MHLIFIRHGDPDYANDTVTEKGKREAEILAERISKWNIKDFYCSPMGRAQDTLKPALLKMNRTCETKEWLREFNYHFYDFDEKRERGLWDYLPRKFYGEKKFHNIKKWFKYKGMSKYHIQKKYEDLCREFDNLLASYDYNRVSSDVAVYNCLPHLTLEEASIDTHLLADQKKLDDTTLVFVCHLGVMLAIISHLTGISPVNLWQGFFVAPTSVTVLGAEERIPGEVAFRVQTLGDVRHLIEAGEPGSASGFFGNFTNF